MEVKIYKIQIQEEPNKVYIGATTTDLSNRLSQHIYDARNRSNTKSKWLKQALDSNHTVNIYLLEITNSDFYKEREEFYFKYYTDKNFVLMNTYLKSAGIIINRSFQSIKRSSEAKYLSIEQLDYDNNIIKIWKSASEAEKELGVLSTAIGNVLNGRSPSAGGYFWRYKNSKKLKPKDKKAKNCFLTDKLTSKEIEFNTISSAARSINENVDKVIAVLYKNENFENDKYIISRYSLVS